MVVVKALVKILLMKLRMEPELLLAFMHLVWLH